MLNDNSSVSLPVPSRPYVRWLAWLAVISLIAGLLAALFEVYVPRNAVSVTDQPRGMTMMMKYVWLKKGGYVAIHDVDELGKLGERVGFSYYLKPGLHRRVTVGITDNESPSPRALVVLLYEDPNTEGHLDIIDWLNVSRPLKDLFGRIIVKKFTVQ